MSLAADATKHDLALMRKGGERLIAEWVEREFASRANSSEALFEIRSLAAGFRRHFLGHELKSFDILAGVIGG